MTAEGKDAKEPHVEPYLSYWKRALAATIGVLAVFVTGDPESFDRKPKR